MSSDSPRQRLLAVAARRLKQGTSPYWTMTGFLFLAGAAGFVASVLLLHLGLDRMWLRYPLAVTAGYLTFLGLLAVWLRGQRGESGTGWVDGGDLADAAQVLDAVTPSSSGGVFGGWGSGSVKDVKVGDSDGCAGLVVAVLVTLLIVAVLFAAVYAVVIAPTLLAELLVDGLVVGSLPRRRTRHWTRTALARTGWLALLLAVVLGLVGAGLEAVVPGAHTMGQAMGFGRAK